MPVNWGRTPPPKPAPKQEAAAVYKPPIKQPTLAEVFSPPVVKEPPSAAEVAAKKAAAEARKAAAEQPIVDCIAAAYGEGATGVIGEAQAKSVMRALEKAGYGIRLTHKGA